MVRSIAVSLLLVFAWTALALAAGGGRVSYPSGSPVVGASVQVMKDEKERLALQTDAQGRFSLPDKKFRKCIVQINVPDKTAFAPVYLPVEMFQGNDLAIVLQPKQ